MIIMAVFKNGMSSAASRRGEEPANSATAASTALTAIAVEKRYTRTFRAVPFRVSAMTGTATAGSTSDKMINIEPCIQFLQESQQKTGAHFFRAGILRLLIIWFYTSCRQISLLLYRKVHIKSS